MSAFNGNQFYFFKPMILFKHLMFTEKNFLIDLNLVLSELFFLVFNYFQIIFKFNVVNKFDSNNFIAMINLHIFHMLCGLFLIDKCKNCFYFHNLRLL